MAASTIHSVNDSDAQFLPFKSSVPNKLKITRKRSEVELKNGDFYPGEGHKYIELHQDDVSEYYFLGGVRRGEDAAWVDSSKIMKIKIVSTDDDIYIESIENVVTKGSMIPTLTSSGMVWGAEPGKYFVIWGGLDVLNYTVVDDLYICKPVVERKKQIFDITQYTGSAKSFGQYGDHGKIQTNSPTARAGHSLNKLPGKANVAIMFGGYEMPNREKEMAFAEPFAQVCVDGRFHMLKINGESMEWSVLPVPSVKPRCFHTADFISDDKLAIVGGLAYTKNTASHRLPLHDVTVLYILNYQTNDYQMYSVLFDMQPTFISFQSSCVVDGILYIFGGYLQSKEELDPDQDKIVSCKLFKLDFFTCKSSECDAGSDYLSCGGSLLNVEPQTLLIVSGCCQKYYVYTSKPFVPGPCDLAQHGMCQIKDTPETSPIQWVQCEGGCKQWHHFFCTGLKRIPKGKYLCKLCSERK